MSTGLSRLDGARGAVQRALDICAELAHERQASRLEDDCRRDQERVAIGPRIAIVGAFSSGKTTFVNALFGRRVLPMRNTPTTASITEIRSGDRCHARVQLKSREDLELELQSARDALTKRQKEHVESGDAGLLEEIRSLRNFIELDLDRDYPAEQRLEFDLSDGAQSQALERFLAEGHSSKAPFVDRVYIEYAFAEGLMPRDVTLLDTPGLNSDSELHRRATMLALRNADAVLFFTQASMPLTGSDKMFLERIRDMRRGEPNGTDRFLFVVNAIDRVDPDETPRASIVDHVRTQLEAMGLEAPTVCPLSSKIALLGRLHAVDGSLSRRERGDLMMETDDEPSAAWVMSHMEATLDACWSRAGLSAVAHTLTDASDRVERRLQEMQRDLETEKDLADKTLSHAEGRVGALRDVIANKRKQRDRLLSKVRRHASDKLEPIRGVNELAERLLEQVDADGERWQIQDAMRGIIFDWFDEREAAVGQMMDAIASAIQDLIEGALVEVERTRREVFNLEEAFAIGIVLDLDFDLPPPEAERPEDISTKAGWGGAILGGVLGAFFGVGVGVALGAALGNLLGRGLANPAVQQLRKLRAGRRREVKRIIEQRVAIVEACWDDWLETVIDLLVAWAGRQFDGFLADLEVQFERWLSTSREAESSGEAVAARLAQATARMDEARAALAEAQVAIREAGRTPDHAA